MAAVRFKILIITVVLISGLVCIHPLLAVHRPIDADMLVIEGWLPAPFMEQARHQMDTGDYQAVVIVGIEAQGRHPAGEGQHLKNRSALEKQYPGVFKDIRIVITPYAQKYKTYTYAKHFSSWLKTHHPGIDSVNIFTGGVHARKSRYLFTRLLAPDVRVGVISAEPVFYDRRFWWRSRRGIRLVFKNSIALVMTYLTFNFMEQA